MNIVRKDEPSARLGSTFTGPTYLAELVNPPDPTSIKLTLVHFENGALTDWHIHPGEQILYVLEGEGRVGTEVKQVAIHPGDVVHAPAGEKHWHGAAHGHSMTHLSITRGGSPTWLEPPNIEKQ
jgi:quercetin dioxygenase-like cupin family protein